MSNTYSFLHTVATQTPAIRSLHDLSVYHHQLWEIVLIGFFTLMATLAWYIFVKRSANKELGRRGALWRAFWQASSPAIITIIGIISASLLLRVIALDFIPELLDWIAPLRLIAIALVVVLGMFRYINASERIHVDNGSDSTTASALSKVAKASVLTLAFLAVGQNFGLSLSGLLAFGGAGGLIIGLAGKDILANFFGGLMIFVDRPFQVGDWISSPDRNIEGTVEKVGWRLTRIFTFDNRPMYVPNSAFSTISVVNPQRMTNRRINTTIGLRYQDLGRMQAVVENVRAMLRAHPDIDQEQVILVYFSAFGDSSVNFMVYCFTRTTKWAEWLSVQQDVFLKIVGIVQAQGADFAFPSRTLYFDPASLPKAGGD